MHYHILDYMYYNCCKVSVETFIFGMLCIQCLYVTCYLIKPLIKFPIDSFHILIKFIGENNCIYGFKTIVTAAYIFNSLTARGEC